MVFLSFHSLNQCIFNIKKHVQCISWVISNMAINELCPALPCWFYLRTEEYELITLIYNGKPFRLDLLFWCMQGWFDMELQSLNEDCLNTNWSKKYSPSPHSGSIDQLIYHFLDDLHLQIIAQNPPLERLSIKWPTCSSPILWKLNLVLSLFFR